MGRPSKYTEEFRREAVELLLSGDRPAIEGRLVRSPHNGATPTKIDICPNFWRSKKKN